MQFTVFVNENKIKYTECETSMHTLAATTGKALSLHRDIGSESENPSFEVAMWFSYAHKCYLVSFL